MQHHRILCLRFPNWPVQAHRLRTSREGCGAGAAVPAATAATTPIPAPAPSGSVAIALHTPQPEASVGEAAVTDAQSLHDLSLVRQLFPAARTGPAVVAVSSAAWKRGVRPGLPLAEARSLAAPLQSSPQTDVQRKPVKRDDAAREGEAPAEQPAADSRKGRSPRNSGSIGDRREPRGGHAAQQELRTPEPVLFVPWNPAADRAELRQLSDPVRRFAPVVGLDSLPLPDSLLLDVTGCGPLFGGEEHLAKELLQMLRQAGLRGRVAIAETIASAWAIAHTDVAGSPELVIVSREASRQQLADLPVAAARLSPADLEILQHLGILRIGQLLTLPIEDLPARLSAECVMRVRQLRGDVVEQIDPLPEVHPVMAAWVGDEPAAGVRDLQWILGRLCEDIAGQLDQRRLACSGLDCEFIAVDGRTLAMPAGLVRPERTPQLLADVLSLRLEFLVLQDLRKTQTRQPAAGRATSPAVDRESLNDPGSLEPAVLPPLDFGALAEQPMAAVRVTAVSSPIPAGRQRRLFADAGEQAEDVTEPLGTLLSRLAGRLGADAVLTVCERDDARPEHSIGFSPVTGAGFERLLEELAGTSGGLSGGDRAERGGSRGSGSSRGTARSGASRGADRRLIRPDQEGGSSADCRPPRPLRLLAEPVEVVVEWIREVSAVAGTGRGADAAAGAGASTAERLSGVAILRCLGREWRVVEWTGPERIQTAWWTDSACHRDYYQAVSEEGARFWLFRELLQGGWYLHGLYD
ncbi:MAG: hypothetical protein ACKO2P_19900 [Planctomycetota bacterium]